MIVSMHEDIRSSQLRQFSMKERKENIWITAKPNVNIYRNSPKHVQHA